MIPIHKKEMLKDLGTAFLAFPFGIILIPSLVYLVLRFLYNSRVDFLLYVSFIIAFSIYIMLAENIIKLWSIQIDYSENSEFIQIYNRRLFFLKVLKMIPIKNIIIIYSDSQDNFGLKWSDKNNVKLTRIPYYVKNGKSIILKIASLGGIHIERISSDSNMALF